MAGEKPPRGSLKATRLRRFATRDTPGLRWINAFETTSSSRPRWICGVGTGFSNDPRWIYPLEPSGFMDPRWMKTVPTFRFHILGGRSLSPTTNCLPTSQTHDLPPPTAFSSPKTPLTAAETARCPERRRERRRARFGSRFLAIHGPGDPPGHRFRHLALGDEQTRAPGDPNLIDPGSAVVTPRPLPPGPAGRSAPRPAAAKGCQPGQKPA